jgi:hypothetical protein
METLNLNAYGVEERQFQKTFEIALFKHYLKQ